MRREGLTEGYVEAHGSRKRKKRGRLPKSTSIAPRRPLLRAYHAHAHLSLSTRRHDGADRIAPPGHDRALSFGNVGEVVGAGAWPRARSGKERRRRRIRRRIRRRRRRRIGRRRRDIGGVDEGRRERGRGGRGRGRKKAGRRGGEEREEEEGRKQEGEEKRRGRRRKMEEEAEEGE